MRYCSTWLRSLLCYIEKFVIEEFAIRVLVLHCIMQYCIYVHHNIIILYITTCAGQYMNTCTCTQMHIIHQSM